MWSAGSSELGLGYIEFRRYGSEVVAVSEMVLAEVVEEEQGEWRSMTGVVREVAVRG